MDADDIRTRLQEELEALRTLSAGTKASRAPVALDQQSVGRLSRMDAMQVQAMAQMTEQRRQTRIRRVEAALDRLQTDDFGFCVTCGDEIAEARLELDPTATLCATCIKG